MSRFLVVAPPFPGHVTRMVPYAEELRARGHQVTWATFPGLVGHLLPDGAAVVGLPEEPARAVVAGRRARAAEAASPRALGLGTVEETVVPLCEAMLPGVDEAADACRAECVLADVACLAGSFAARRRGLPWATTAEPAIAVLQGLDGLAARHGREHLDALQRRHGLDPVPRPYWSPHLILVNSVRELVGDAALDPAVRLVGATVDHRRPDVPFPWERLGDEPLVYVTLGTTIEHLGARFVHTVLEALAARRCRSSPRSRPSSFPTRRRKPSCSPSCRRTACWSGRAPSSPTADTARSSRC